MAFISFRSSPELDKIANLLANLDCRNKSDEYRTIFSTGLEERRKEIALDKYRKKEISINRAAEIAGLSVWGFLELMKEKNVELNLELEDIVKGAEEIDS